MFPEDVAKLVAIEGIFPTPDWELRMKDVPFARRVRDYIAEKRKAAGRPPRLHPPLEDANGRTTAANN